MFIISKMVTPNWNGPDCWLRCTMPYSSVRIAPTPYSSICGGSERRKLRRPLERQVFPSLRYAAKPLSWQSRQSCGLLQRRVDRGELLVEGGAEAVDDSDDGQRDAGGDQSVFDGGGPRLILNETHKKL